MIVFKQIAIFFSILIILSALSYGADISGKYFGLKAALLVEMDSCKILYEQRPYRLIQPASLAKILTLYLANENIFVMAKINNERLLHSKAIALGGVWSRILGITNLSRISLLEFTGEDKKFASRRNIFASAYPVP